MAAFLVDDRMTCTGILNQFINEGDAFWNIFTNTVLRSRDPLAQCGQANFVLINLEDDILSRVNIKGFSYLRGDDNAPFSFMRTRNCCM
jgi:hypothetical protein